MVCKINIIDIILIKIENFEVISEDATQLLIVMEGPLL